MLVAVGSSRAAVSHLLILTCLQTLVDTVNRCAENFILFFSPVTMCVFFGVFLIVCFVVSINKETFVMSNVRRYGLATGGIMRALLAESGLITCCDVFSWLYGTDVTFGLSQHERSTNVLRYHLLRSVTNPSTCSLFPLGTWLWTSQGQHQVLVGPVKIPWPWNFLVSQGDCFCCCKMVLQGFVPFQHSRESLNWPFPTSSEVIIPVEEHVWKRKRFERWEAEGSWEGCTHHSHWIAC